jgi:hypothetical protein
MGRGCLGRGSCWVRELYGRTAGCLWKPLQLLRHSLPRSRHLPTAVTEGSLTENLNKTGVRLWTDRSIIGVLDPG